MLEIMQMWKLNELGENKMIQKFPQEPPIEKPCSKEWHIDFHLADNQTDKQNPIGTNKQLPRTPQQVHNTTLSTTHNTLVSYWWVLHRKN